jgi:hypothetical protein
VRHTIQIHHRQACNFSQVPSPIVPNGAENIEQVGLLAHKQRIDLAAKKKISRNSIDLNVVILNYDI